MTIIATLTARCKDESAKHEGHDVERDENLPRWYGFHSLRRFHATEVRGQASSETTSKALGNSKEIADRHYIKPTGVLPDVRKAVNDGLRGLVVN